MKKLSFYNFAKLLLLLFIISLALCVLLDAITQGAKI